VGQVFNLPWQTKRLPPKLPGPRLVPAKSVDSIDSGSVYSNADTNVPLSSGPMVIVEPS
jgi:hypothetical protein